MIMKEIVSVPSELQHTRKVSLDFSSFFRETAVFDNDYPDGCCQKSPNSYSRHHMVYKTKSIDECEAYGEL